MQFNDKTVPMFFFAFFLFFCFLTFIINVKSLISERIDSTETTIS